MKQPTKKQVLNSFQTYILPHIRETYERDGRVNTIARREAWNDYMDMMHEEGNITTKQYKTWMNPYL